MKKEYDFRKGRRGPVIKQEAGKTRITIRIDDEVLDWFRTRVHEAGGGNYQTLINDAWREHIGLHREDLDSKIRRLVREELSSVVREGTSGVAGTGERQGPRRRRRASGSRS